MKRWGVFFMIFRNKSRKNDPKRILEWWLKNYAICGRQAGVLGLIVSLNNFSEPFTSKFDLAMKIGIALISLNLLIGQNKLARNVNEIYHHWYKQDLRAFTTPPGMMILTIVIMLMIFVDSTWREPATKAAYFMLGWTLFVVTCLYAYIMAEKLRGVWKKLFGLHTTSEIEIDVIEPEWYIKSQQISQGPEATESPREHYFVPTGKIEVIAKSTRDDLIAIIEMKETKRPPKESS